MKTKLEDFKDRSELFQWAADRKPINCEGRIYTIDRNGYYGNTLLLSPMSFNLPLADYKKVIEIETFTISESYGLVAYLNGGVPNFDFSIPLADDITVLANLKITATIEKCKETGEIVDKKFKLEEVE